MPRQRHKRAASSSNTGILAKLDTVARIVVNPDLCRDGALNRVPKVILMVAFAIRPAVHSAERRRVPTPEWIMLHGQRSAIFGSNTLGLHKAQIAKRGDTHCSFKDMVGTQARLAEMG